MKFLIVGLGNIGPEYENTRHNIGFRIVDELSVEKKASWELKRYALYTHVKQKGKVFHLIKPTTFMNLSGKAVRYWMKELKIPIENILILVDDVALPLGKLRMRAKGSSAGHNGLRDIEYILNSQSYPRLKFGIGNEFPKGRQKDFVLSDFTPEEEAELPALIDRSIEMVYSFGIIGIAKTMSVYNS